MSGLDKNYYRQQYNYVKRELEKHFDMFGLNQQQKQRLREIVDRMLEEQRKEYVAPEVPPKESNVEGMMK